MDEIDSSVGYWLKNVPYVFENDQKFPEDHTKSFRKYLLRYPELLKLQNCPSWASNYFHLYRIFLHTIIGAKMNQPPISFMDGRRYYYINHPKGLGLSPKFEISYPDNDPSKISLDLSKYNGVYFDMASLICSQLAKSYESWDDVLDVLKKCPPVSECDPCTKVGTKIARSLIKIAALRIFADPEQSIMELPVNSMDAYNPDRKIGKFGMGFFSILYWLVGHPKRYFEFHSFSKDADGKFVTFKVRIQEKPSTDGTNSLAFELTTYPESKITTTGFRAVLNAEEDKFTTLQVNNFNLHLAKLDYISGATLYKVAPSKIEIPKSKFSQYVKLKSDEDRLNGKIKICDFRESKVINPETNKPIFCGITDSFLLVEDFATGIPYEVVFGSLFVPSISTKTIQMSNSLPFFGFDNKSRYIKDTGLRDLVFLIGGIAVVSIVHPLCFPDTYAIDLPPTTRLPVSRDDIILTEETEKILLESIAIVFDETMKATQNVSCFQTLLNKYIEFTPSSENKRVVKKAMNDFYIKNKSKLVPYTYEFFYKGISEKIPGGKFVVSTVYDASSIEEFLDKNTKPDSGIWYGTKVLIIKDIPLDFADGGLISYIFIDEKYKNRNSNWISAITSSYRNKKLYPVSSSYGSKEYAKYETLTKKPSSSVIKTETTRNYYFSVLNKFESLEDKFEIAPEALQSFGTDLLEIYTCIEEESFLKILSELMVKFSDFKGNQTYGGEKYKLYYENTLFGSYEMKTLFGEKSGKLNEYTVEQIIYAIRAINERQITIIVTITKNAPWHIYNVYFFPVFYEELYEQSANYTEFCFVATGAGQAFLKKSTRRDAEENRTIVKEITTHFIDKIRLNQRTSRELIDLFILQNNESMFEATTTYIWLIKDRTEAIEWIKTVNGISNIPIGTLPEISGPSEKQIELSSMIKTLFKTDVPKTSGLTDERNFYSSFEGTETPSKLQIIEIAVNEGTVKPFIEAAMTELVQNSIDAVREFKPKNTNIDIDLKRTQKSDRVILSITDRVGMTKEAFIYVGIPFLSTKTPSELVTGEMGSGFFNAYRESEFLIVDSIKDGVNRRSEDVPVRDKQRVVDIKKTITIENAKLDNQTRITMSIPIQNDAQYANIVSRVFYTARNVLGLAESQNIKFNGKSIYVSRQLVAKLGHLELYITPSDHDHESYLLTKGIPFSPLKGYFKNFLSERSLEQIDRNFILNITHGGYTPVQTRTRVNLAPEVEKDFITMARYSVFIKMVREISEGHKLYALDHVESQADPRQLRFTIYNVTENKQDEDFYLKYVKFYDQPCIAELINGCIADVKLITDINARTEFLAKTYKTPFPLINQRVIQIVNTWFRYKKMSATPGKVKPESPKKAAKYSKLTIPKLKEILKERKLKVSGTKPELIKRLEENDGVDDEEDDKSEEVPDEEFTEIISAWITVYWKLAIEQKIKGFAGIAPVCRVVYSEKEQGSLGYFDPRSRKITINTYTWKKEDRDDILKVLKRKNIEDFNSGVLKKNKAWERFFSYSFPSSTIVHELEHARRNNSHATGPGHDAIYGQLFPGDTVASRTFNECANAAFEKVLALDFYGKFLLALK